MRYVLGFLFLIFFKFNSLAVNQAIYEAVSDVYVRAGIGTRYEIVGVVKAGEEVIVLDKSNSNWFKIESGVGSGYISSRFLKFKVERNPPSEIPEEVSEPDGAIPGGAGFGLAAMFFVIIIIALFLLMVNSRKKKRIAHILSESAKRQSVVKVYSSVLTAPDQKKEMRVNQDISNSGNLKLVQPDQPIRYIHSKTTLNPASKAQKIFYMEFKSKFLEGIFFDLRGNNNYAFILIHDLLDEYDHHRDFAKLEIQLSTIASVYPKVRSHALGLIQNAKSELIIPAPSQIESNDDSILDITNEISEPLSKMPDPVDQELIAPDWPHKYIYSKNDLKSATSEQKIFYNHYKQKFLNNVCIGLQGNTNYAFVLLFDLLDGYEQHKDLEKLEPQINRLGNVYYKTRQYGIKFLNEIKRKEGLIPQIPEVRIRYTPDPPAATPANYDTYPEYVYWKLGSKYKDKLDLNEEEVGLLNKLWEGTNNFTAIEFCYFQVMRLYLDVLKGFKQLCDNEETTPDEVFLIVSDLVARFQFKYRKGSSNYNMSLRNTSDLLYAQIFKRCENELREHYGHKRKLNMDSLFSDPRIMMELESKIIFPISILLSELITKIPAPDEDTQIELNSLNSSRWKTEFDDLCGKFEKDPVKFVSSIVALGTLNRKNQSIENVFYEASKFIAPKHSQSALILYLHYLYHDLKSIRFDNKPLTKTIQKSIFKSAEQVEQFKLIVENFLKDKNLEKATKAIPFIFAVKRKKITLNKLSIEEVKQKHAGTVELLNEYLQEEEESNFDLAVSTSASIPESKELSFTISGEQSVLSAFLDEIPFLPIHFQALGFFVKNNLSVPISEFEEFAKSQGVFKNQLIDAINEACFDILDDILIEEEEEFYTIEAAYFQTISAK